MDNGAGVMMAESPVIGQVPARPAPESVLRIALDVLSVRIARWVSLLMSFALFAFTVWQPTWPRLASAAAFTALVHCPMWWKRDR